MKPFRLTLAEVGTADAIRDFLNQNIEDLSPVLSYSQQDRNDRVEIGDVAVREVRILDSGILEIDYEYQWSYFSGCKDISGGGIETETLSTRLVGGVIEIHQPERPEPRSTVDEF